MDERNISNGNTSLVLGIISIVLSVLGLFKVVAIVLGIVGIVLSHKIRMEVQTASTGFILSIIGLTLSSIRVVLTISLFIFPFSLFCLI